MKFSIHMVPVPKARPRLSRYGVYTPKKTKDFEQEFLLRAGAYCPTQPMHGALQLSIRFIMPSPKKCKHAFPVSRPDLDNLAKAVMDAMNGRFYVDDSQIVKLILEKNYGIAPRIDIDIKTIACLENPTYSDEQ